MLIKNKRVEHPQKLIVEICGYCAAPTTYHAQDGTLSYHLNVARNWTKGNPKSKNFTEGALWVSSTAWGELAEELLALNIGKASHVTLRGHARPNEWVDAKGNLHSDLEITALISVEIHRLIPAEESAKQPAKQPTKVPAKVPAQEPEKPQVPQGGAAADGPPPFLDDIPF